MVVHVMDGCQCTGKTCSKCKEWRCCGDFRRAKKLRSGLRPSCKQCDKAFRAEHAQQLSDHHRNYYTSHRDQERARTLRYQEANRERVMAREKAYKRSAQGRMADKRHRLKHPELTKLRGRISQAKNRARKLQAEGTYTVQQWVELKAQYGSTCLRCGRREPEIKLVPDHVKPLAMGGSNDISNIQPLCVSCNCRKHNKHVDYRGCDLIQAALAPCPVNICTPRPQDALQVPCEIMDCEEWATYNCYPQITAGSWSLQQTIAVCDQHAREADPTLDKGDASRIP